MSGLRALAAVAAGVAVGAAAPASAEPDFPFGVWRNPKNSVHVDIRPCGDGACGYVIWANAKAQADAREGGTEQLVGLQLFRNFQPEGRGVWRGKVFVPDLNGAFSGTAAPMGEDALQAKGCLLGRIFCKSQVWTRVRG